jgi:hypothetical protein
VFGLNGAKWAHGAHGAHGAKGRRGKVAKRKVKLEVDEDGGTTSGAGDVVTPEGSYRIPKKRNAK